jgi:membrane-bound lytic murein transglycosylase D
MVLTKFRRIPNLIVVAFWLCCGSAFGSVPDFKSQNPQQKNIAETLKQRLQAQLQNSRTKPQSSLFFDLPLTYNQKVSQWINHFQNTGKNWFKSWIERSTHYMPFIQNELQQAGLPQDLAFMVMIESGFEANAISHANAVGPWQFIRPTGERYGLKVHWWLDERRDLAKSTRAAIRYIKDLYAEFGSWYLVAASYNMGENGLRRQILKHQTRDFWELSRKGALPQETIDYVPKILAVMIITKSPELYGFTNITRMIPLSYDLAVVPGGTELDEIADHLEVTRKSLRDLNAELLTASIPFSVAHHTIRIPKGSQRQVAEFLKRSSQRMNVVTQNEDSRPKRPQLQ